MYTDTEGVVLKQVKTLNNRKMILLFSRKFGKISAGSNVSERGKSKSSLALKPFTYGRYELFKNKETYNINSTEVIKSYYKIGEDIEKYMICSYILEFTEKLIPLDQPSPALFELLIEYLEIISKRKKGYMFFALAFQIKAIQLYGSAPFVEKCTICGHDSEKYSLSVSNGGIVCENCMKDQNLTGNLDESLIFELDFGILDVIRYILDNPLSSLEKLGMKDENLRKLKDIVNSYIIYHLDIRDLKSEGFLLNNEVIS
ncbi:MAG: DNA repair protein RecO [Eubacteriales bacterium]